MAELVSEASSVVTATPDFLDWWLKDPSDPTRNIAVDVVDWEPTRAVNTGVYAPRGRTEAVVASGDILGMAGTLVLRTLSKAVYDSAQTLIRSKRTLLLQSVLPQQWYVKLSGPINERIVRAAPLPAEATPIRHLFELSADFTEVRAP